jgi:hypothetical protein
MARKETVVFTLIGDVVASRQAGDRGLLQRSLGDVLERMNEELSPPVPLWPTIGDEFQACFEDVATAVRASLMVRLDLLRTAGVDSRYGLGVGPVETLSKRRLLQDGPGWWSARNAIEWAKRQAAESHTSSARTHFTAFRTTARIWEGEEAALNAFLLCRDAMVDRMKQPARSRLYGLMRGWSQSQIAAEEGASQGAISQSLARSDAHLIVAAQRQLEQQYR